MEVVEVKSTVYPNAHELPNATARPTNKHVSNKGAGSGTRKKNANVTPMSAAARKADHDISEENRRVLIIDAYGRKHWMLLSEYRLTHPA